MNEQTIGSNIRSIRLEAGLTLAALAKNSDLTKGAISKIENGLISAPISTLMRIAQALNVPIVEFFSEKTQQPVYVFTKKGTGTVVNGRGTELGYAYEGLALEKKDKLVEPFLLTINPGDPPGEFYHEGQEFVYMLEGVMDFTVGDTTMQLKSGDSLFFDSGVKHKYQIIGKKPVKFVCVFIQNKRKQEAAR